MDFRGQNILSTDQFDKSSLRQLFEEATRMEDVIQTGHSDLLKGKVLATLFFEPSTRTRFSFETAMLRLGGSVISNADMEKTSSSKKQETLFDTGKVVSQMADAIAVRHPKAGSVAKFAEGSDVPVLNAGDGAGGHPTQGLLDLYTIWKEKGTLDGLTIGIIGDLKYGRVPHSQCGLLKHFDVNFVFVSPEALKMPRKIVDDLLTHGHNIIEVDSLADHIGEMDVISMTRIQEERFESKEEYKKYAGSYVLDNALMNKAKKDSIIIHPLPRVDEISTEVDEDPRAIYFKQVKNGVALRMAILSLVLS